MVALVDHCAAASPAPAVYSPCNEAKGVEVIRTDEEAGNISIILAISPPRLTEVTAPDGQIYIQLNLYGRLWKVQNSASQTTIYTYDDTINAVTKITNANDTWTTYGYDALGRVREIKNYNANNELMSRFYYHYDANSNRTRIDLLNNDYMLYSYDALSRLTQEEKRSSSDQILWRRKYTHDAVGNRTQMDYFDGTTTKTTTYSHNSLNQLTTENRQTESIIYNYSYDENGNLTQKTGNGETWNYYYNYDDRMVRVRKTAGGSTVETQFLYDALGRRIVRTANDCVRTRYFYDGLNPLIEYESEHTTAGNDSFSTSVLSSDWTVDSGVWSLYDSQYLQTTENSPSNTYHRRIRYSEAGSAVMDPKISVKAKALGAPTSDAHAFVMYTKLDDNVGLAGFDWDARNQQFNWVITDYHDSEQWWAYGDDTKDATQWMDFDVEVAGARVEIKEEGDTVISKMFAEPIPQGAVGLATFGRDALFDDWSVEKADYEVSRVFTDGPGQVGSILMVRQYADPQSYTDTWFHYDFLGNVMNHSNASGVATATNHQDAYGNVIDASSGAWLDESSQAGFHLTTKEYDADVGLYFFWARWYDPSTGRFVRRDPVREINLYSYCRNNPASVVDPAGEWGSFQHCMWTIDAIMDVSVAALGYSAPSMVDCAAAAASANTAEDKYLLQTVNHFPDCPYGKYWERRNRYRRYAFFVCDCADLGRFLHYVQDYYSHKGYICAHDFWTGVDDPRKHPEAASAAVTETYAWVKRWFDKCKCELLPE